MSSAQMPLFTDADQVVISQDKPLACTGGACPYKTNCLRYHIRENAVAALQPAYAHKGAGVVCLNYRAIKKDGAGL